MAKLNVKYPPTKKATAGESEEREKNLYWFPGGPVSPISENQRAQEHYARLIRDGVEDERDFPGAVSMDNYRDVYPNPKNRTPLRRRKFGDEGNVDADIYAWNLRNRPEEMELRKKCKTKAKPKRAAKKKVVKKCKCK